MNDEVGATFFFVAIVTAAILLGFTVGRVTTKSNVNRECVNFNKIEIETGVWATCIPILKEQK